MCKIHSSKSADQFSTTINRQTLDTLDVIPICDGLYEDSARKFLSVTMTAIEY